MIKSGLAQFILIRRVKALNLELQRPLVTARRMYNSNETKLPKNGIVILFYSIWQIVVTSINSSSICIRQGLQQFKVLSLSSK